MGLFDFVGDIFKPSEKKTKVKNKLPAWVNDASKANYEKATQIASRPYEAYTGPKVAEFTPDQLKAQEMLRGFKPVGAEPPSILDDINGYSTADYMNPFLDQVMAGVMSDLALARDQNLQGVEDSAHAAGAFGDARHGIEGAGVRDDYGRSVARESANLRMKAYADAMGLKEGDLERLLASDDAMYEYMDALERSGKTQQQRSQAQIDADMEEFYRAQGYDAAQIDWLMKNLNQTKGNYDTKQVTTAPGPSMFDNALAVGQTAASIYTGMPRAPSYSQTLAQDPTPGKYGR